MIGNIVRIVSKFGPPAPPSAPAVEPANALLAERARVMREISRFDPITNAPGVASQARERARDALRELEAAEADALRAWAADGNGPAPKRDRDAHAALVAGVQAAEQALDEAEAAARAIEPLVSKAHAALRLIAIRIDFQRASEIAADAQRQVAELAAIFSDAHDRLNKLVGIREALFVHGDNIRSRGDLDRAQPWLSASGSLADIGPVTITTNVGKVSAYATALARKIREA